jgi:hypothetical protein
MNYLVDAEAPVRAVHTQIEFLRPTEARAYSYNYEPAPHEPPPTAQFEPHDVLIRNLRRAPVQLSLDRHGAALVEHRSALRDFYDEARIVEVYYPEAAALIKSAMGAQRVAVFDHNVRCGQGMPRRPNRYARGRPVFHAHTDYTETSCLRRLHEVFGEEAATLRHRRFVQINLWRPISGPLRDAPLAICNASSIAPQHLAPVDLIYSERRGEIYYLKYDPSQRWYFASDMQPDEAWLLGNCDSDAASSARFAAHSAFNDPTPWSHVPARESIEVRAFAIF